MAKLDRYIQHLLLMVVALTSRYTLINNDLQGSMKDMNVYEDWRTEPTYQRPVDQLLVQLTEIRNESVVLEADLCRIMAEISASGSHRSRRAWQRQVMEIQRQLQNLQTEVTDSIQTLSFRTARYRGIRWRTISASMLDLQEAILTRRGRTPGRRALIGSMLESKNSEENAKDPLRFSSCPDIPELLDDLDMDSFHKSYSMNRTIDFKDPKRKMIQKLYDNIANLAQRFNTTRHSSELRDQDTENDGLTPLNRFLLFSRRNNSPDVSPSKNSEDEDDDLYCSHNNHSVSSLSQDTDDDDGPTPHCSYNNRPGVSSSEDTEDGRLTLRHSSHNNIPGVSSSESSEDEDDDPTAQYRSHNNVSVSLSQNATRISPSQSCAQADNESKCTTEKKTSTTVCASDNPNGSLSVVYVVGVSTAICKTMVVSCAAILFFF